MDKIHRMTLQCADKDCSTRIRVGRFLYDPVLKRGPLAYCPICGGPAFTHTDGDETYWETLAEAYELPVAALKEIYNLWHSDIENTKKFSEFVQELKAEAGLVSGNGS